MQIINAVSGTLFPPISGSHGDQIFWPQTLYAAYMGFSEAPLLGAVPVGDVRFVVVSNLVPAEDWIAGELYIISASAAPSGGGLNGTVVSRATLQPFTSLGLKAKQGSWTNPLPLNKHVWVGMRFDFVQHTPSNPILASYTDQAWGGTCVTGAASALAVGSTVTMYPNQRVPHFSYVGA